MFLDRISTQLRVDLLMTTWGIKGLGAYVSMNNSSHHKAFLPTLSHLQSTLAIDPWGMCLMGFF
jgi:hypothetical protein